MSLSTEKIQALLDNLNKVLLGKARVVEMVAVALLCQGHVLVEDVPGLGKTMLVKALAKSMGSKYSRIQFTPDLLPSDVVGVTVYNQQTMEFQYRPGPVMANIVLADEINRTSPKTQSSLLEAMEEGQVTVDGVTRPLPKPFMVFATQNPIEYEGTFPLPEAQLDRFLLRLEIGYPDAATEGQIIRTQEFGHHPLETIEQVITASELLAAQEAAAQVKLEDNMVRYIIELCSRTRDISALYLGASPRGSLGLARAAKALAWLRGRQYVIPDDIKELAVPVLAHRVLLTPEDKLRGVSTQAIIAKLVNTVPVPTR
ncbi:MAG TPA: MoxR family ATPase [Bacillota bacterium]|nr:MoxR family ATPase [Bacillota bacterium]HPZ91006.1 MoxR family ATPase [Bacillota bacterium]HQE02135.1 MoxR family ATPase [Bacillota bacterium]